MNLSTAWNVKENVSTFFRPKYTCVRRDNHSYQLHKFLVYLDKDVLRSVRDGAVFCWIVQRKFIWKFQFDCLGLFGVFCCFHCWIFMSSLSGLPEPRRTKVNWWSRKAVWCIFLEKKNDHYSSKFLPIITIEKIRWRCIWKCGDVIYS